MSDIIDKHVTINMVEGGFIVTLSDSGSRTFVATSLQKVMKAVREHLSEEKTETE